jgi:hypothetical protein
MYLELPCPSRLLYYIYISAERHNAIQPIIICNLFFIHGIRLGSNPQSLSLPSSAPPSRRSISTPSGVVPLVRWPILLIQPPLRQVKPSTDRSSLSDHHRHWPPTQLHSHCRRRPRRHCVMLGRLSRIGRPPLRQIQAATQSDCHPDHTAVSPIRPQLCRSATTGATIRSIDHIDVAAF